MAFDDIVLFKTNPLGPSYTPPTLSSFTTNYSSYTATYTTPANVIMTAQASDPNSGGSITKVEFYNGDATARHCHQQPVYLHLDDCRRGQLCVDRPRLRQLRAANEFRRGEYHRHQ